MTRALKAAFGEVGFKGFGDQEQEASLRIDFPRRNT